MQKINEICWKLLQLALCFGMIYQYLCVQTSVINLDVNSSNMYRKQWLFIYKNLNKWVTEICLCIKNKIIKIKLGKSMLMTKWWMYWKKWTERKKPARTDDCCNYDNIGIRKKVHWGINKIFSLGIMLCIDVNFYLCLDSKILDLQKLLTGFLEWNIFK